MNRFKLHVATLNKILMKAVLMSLIYTAAIPRHTRSLHFYYLLMQVK